MKKINIAVAALMITMIACNNNDEQEIVQEAVKTTSIRVLTSNSTSSTLAGKNVQRPNSVLDWIDNITIKTKLRGGNHISAEDNFVMTDDGTGDIGFTLDDVALGTNEVMAKAYSYQQNATY